GMAPATSDTNTADATPVSGTCTYIWNTAPGSLTLLPATSVAVHGAPITFALQATDAENDTYSGLVTVYQNGQAIRTVTTATAASGTPSVGVLTDGLAAGSYTWTAVATDQWGSTSGSSPSGS